MNEPQTYTPPSQWRELPSDTPGCPLPGDEWMSRIYEVEDRWTPIMEYPTQLTAPFDFHHFRYRRPVPAVAGQETSAIVVGSETIKRICRLCYTSFLGYAQDDICPECFQTYSGPIPPQASPSPANATAGPSDDQSEKERHDDQMNVALGKLAPKGTWLCEILENIWRAPNVEKATEIAVAARSIVDSARPQPHS